MSSTTRKNVGGVTWSAATRMTLEPAHKSGQPQGMSPWLAAPIVAVVLLVVAGFAGLVSRKQLQQAAAPVPKQAIASVKTDVAEIKELIHQ
jgi:hypothetical protein